jgi:large subunit ribosomal protein L10e
MAIRKSSAYSRIHVTPYTRISKKKNKAYIKVVPPQKIVKFSMGNQKLIADGKLPFKLILVSTEKVQVRHTALEACRQYLNKQLDIIVPGFYVFRVIPFPHHIQRENKMLTGAGADRMQTGMQLSYGKSISKAALLKPGSRIFEFYLPTEKSVQQAREAINQVKPKLPGSTKIIFENISKQ